MGVMVPNDSFVQVWNGVLFIIGLLAPMIVLALAMTIFPRVIAIFKQLVDNRLFSSSAGESAGFGNSRGRSRGPKMPRIKDGKSAKAEPQTGVESS